MKNLKDFIWLPDVVNTDSRSNISIWFSRPLWPTELNRLKSPTKSRNVKQNVDKDRWGSPFNQSDNGYLYFFHLVSGEGRSRLEIVRAVWTQGNLFIVFSFGVISDSKMTIKYLLLKTQQETKEIVEYKKSLPSSAPVGISRTDQNTGLLANI